MRCTHCDSIIVKNAIACNRCGRDIQVVPDYNPLDEVITREVQGGVRDATRPIDVRNISRHRHGNAYESGYTTRIINQEDIDKVRAERRNIRSTGSSSSRNITSQKPVETEKKKKKRKFLFSKQRIQRFFIMLFIALVFVGIIAFVANHNSYQGIVNRGNQAFLAGQMLDAEVLFRRAIDRIPHRAEAYVGLSRVFIHDNRVDEAESLFLNALDGQGANIALFRATVEFYLETDQLLKISILLDGADESVLEALENYVSNPPVLGLEDGNFGEVQEVAIHGDEYSVIHFTVDGSEPTMFSPVYIEPILLTEGVHVIRAFAINAFGIPSLTVSGTYNIELPTASAPVVIPLTGLYQEPTLISIQVPEGYTAHFTMDGSVPTAESQVYVGPIDMPEGRTIFSAILVNNLTGRETEPTVRNFILEL